MKQLKHMKYDEVNRKAAEIILSDPAKHGGESSLAVQWARLVSSRAPQQKQPEMFEKREAA